jgi:outer membrane protein assembly factor BamA
VLKGDLVWTLAATLCLLLADPSESRAEPAKASASSERPLPPPPAGFDGRQAIDPSDYQRKNEGGYFTGLPLANYDSNTGVGLGVRGYYYFNGRRDDPLFAYTPYLYRVFLQGFATTGGLQFHWLDIDIPTIAGTPYRFRSQLIFQRNIEQHYFGLGSRAMQPLTFTGSPTTYRKFADYQAALDRVSSAGQTHSQYDSYRLTQPLLLLSVERTVLSGLVRPLAGFGFSYNHVGDYTGEPVHAVDAAGHSTTAPMAPTRLSEDCQAGIVVGCSGGWNNFFRLGVSLDTRDYEPDPNRGVFVDAALDIGSRVLGSRYEWARAMLSPRGYIDPFRKWIDLVFAGRATLQIQSQSSPFFGMNYLPYTEDPRTGLGGLRTLRGFKQDRFVGPVMALLNAEVRWTFVHFEVASQKFALIAVPDLDLGATYDRVSSIRLSGWRRSQGAALRISWNLATIVTTEYAFSDEDSAFYINFNHMF